MQALIVDDSSINLKVAQKLIEHVGLNVQTALSGQECLDKMQQETYDIIFMDIMMPDMDGVETLNKIRTFNESVPVIALTADATIGAKEKYLSLGFQGYISKPINIEILRKLLADLP